MRNLFVFLFATFMLASCTNHGDKVSKDYLEVYYKDGVTKDQAEKFLNYLYPMWKEDAKDSKRSVQLTKTGDTVNFRMVTDMDMVKKENIQDDVFYTMGNEFSAAAFNNAPVNVVLTDKFFKTVKFYAYKKMEAPDYGEKVTAGNVEVYVKDGFSMDWAKDLATLLNADMKPEAVISFQSTKDVDGYFVINMATTPEGASGTTESQMKVTAKRISDEITGGAPIVFQMTDTQFEPIKKVFYDPHAGKSDTTVAE